ncbi:ABC transporter substrate-binding protein [Chloroflexota bacterium]
MVKKFVWLLISCLMVISLVLVSCGGTTVEEEEEVVVEEEEDVTKEEEEEVIQKGDGEWWDKFGEPEYGGTLVLRATSDPTSWDPYYGGAAVWGFYSILEKLAFTDWSLDREIWDMKSPFVPIKYRVGCLAENWEIPDWGTYIFHIREGIYWQDIYPVNGREFTAYDIEYHFHRLLGLGKYGFTEQSPYVTFQQYALIESIDATDKYTLAIKLKEPSIDTFDTLTDQLSANMIVPPEGVDEWGDVNDWDRMISTGPFILEDFTPSSVLTLKKNTNYWGYDERHPENQLPYVDKVTMLIIPDSSTAQAALRTGKVALLGGLDWETADYLEKTNPELEKMPLPGAAYCLDLRCDNEPFTDIKVRQALQMAVNLEELADVYYGGTVGPEPYGMIGPSLNGYFTPFDEWPQEVKDTYAYNPEGAKALLAEAGYPDGFQTHALASTTSDTDLLQLMNAYFKDINVDLELQIVEYGTFSALSRGGKGDQMIVSGTSFSWPITRCLGRGFSTYIINYTHNNDSVFDEMYNSYSTSLDEEERRLIAVEANDYAIAQHWRVIGVPTQVFAMYQSWFKGYSGENPIGGMATSQYMSRMWIDQDAKKVMGH